MSNVLKRKMEVTQKLIDSGYVLDSDNRLVHRKVCREVNGPYPSNWVVHHIDFDKKNNTGPNLIALPREYHDKIHNVMRQFNTRLTRENIEQGLKQYLKQVPKKKNQKFVINIILELNGQPLERLSQEKKECWKCKVYERRSISSLK